MYHTAPHRKILLLSCAWAGALAATFFLPLSSSSPLWFLSALLAVIANVGFGTSVVAMNAYLPSLARESPEVLKVYANLRNAEESALVLESEAEPDDNNEAVAQPLVRNTTTDEVQELKSHYENELSRTTSRISSFGIALGYGAGIFLLFVALIPVTLMKGSTFSLRLAISLSGIWWAVFSIPALLWLPSGGNSSSVDDDDAIWVDTENVTAGKWSLWKEILAAWKRLGGMLRWSEIKKLRNTYKFLASWFLLSDGKYDTSSTYVCLQPIFFSVHDNYWYCYPFRKDCAQYATVVSHLDRNHCSFIGYLRIVILATTATSVPMVKSAGAPNPLGVGLSGTCLWMSWVYQCFSRPVRRAYNPRRNVWPSCIFRYVA